MLDVSPDPFIEALLGYQKSAALMAALEQRLFTVTGEGATISAALAARMGTAASRPATDMRWRMDFVARSAAKRTAHPSPC
jgi:hypothetical protein